jgi:hypothetical protein
MTKLNFLFLILFLIVFNQNLFSQINPNDLKFQFNTQKNLIEVLQISKNAKLDGLKVDQMTLDVFDKYGDYAGTIKTTDWTLNADEFSPDEKIKISYIQITDTKTGTKIELKDVNLFK